MKWLKTKSESGTYSAGKSDIILNFEDSQRHPFTTHAKVEFVGLYGILAIAQITRTISVHGSGEANG